MKKHIYLLLTSLSILLTGCATQYIEPVDGPKARLRIIPLNLEGEDSRRFGYKPVTAVTITRNSCIKTLIDSYVFASYGKKGRPVLYNQRLKNQTVSIGMPGKYEKHMYEIYIPAEKKITVGYHNLFEMYLSQSISKEACNVGLIFTPKENRDYHAIFDMGANTCYGVILDATDNPEAPVKVEGIKTATACTEEDMLREKSEQNNNKK